MSFDYTFELNYYQDFSKEIENSWRNEIKTHYKSNWIDLNQKISQLIIRNLSLVCDYDITRCDQYYSKKENKYTDLFDNRLIHVPMWLKLYRLLYIICTIFTIIYLIFQYKYDIHLHRYNLYTNYNYQLYPVANTNKQFKNVTKLDVDLELSKLKAQIDHDRNILISIGAPFLNHSFTIEFVYIYIIYISVAVFIEIYIYNHFVHLFDLRTIKTIYDREKIIKHYSRIVSDQVNKFILSNRNFVISLLNRTNDKRTRFITSINCRTRKSKKYQISRIISDYYLLIEQFKLLTLEAKLIPLNKKSIQIDELTLLYNKICFASSTSTFLIVTIYWLATVTIYGWRIENINDLLVMGQFLIPSSISSISVMFYLTSIAINTIEYIKFVKQLKNITIEFIHKSQFNLKGFLNLVDYKREVAESDSCKLDNYDNNNKHSKCNNKLVDFYKPNEKIYLRTIDNFKYQDLNYDLLFILIQYKLLLRQLKFNKPTISLVAFCTLQIQFLAPLLLFIQLPFIKSEIVPILVSCFLFFVILGDCCLIPIAYMHSRCLELCKALFSVMAHSSECINSKTGEYVYSKHTIRVLSKELTNYEQFNQQFAIILLGYKITYPTFVRLHVLIGLLMIYSFSNKAKSIADKSLLENSFKSFFF